MDATVSVPALRALPDLPRDVSPSTRWTLIVGVVLVHVVVATLVVLTSRQPAQIGEVAPILVTLLTETPSGQLLPVVPAPVVSTQPTPVVRPAAATTTPALTAPPVAAVAAPVRANDMAVPVVAPAAVESKAPADAPVTAAAPVAAPATNTVEPTAVAPAAARPMQLSHTAVRYLKKVEPVFPKVSARLGEYGSVTVAVTVDEHGLPVNATVSRSSGYPRLDAAARDAAMQSRYVPYTLNGVPQRFEVPAPFLFTPSNE